MHPDFLVCATWVSSFSRLNCPVLRQVTSTRGVPWRVACFLKPPFYVTYLSVALQWKKSPFEITLFSTLNNTMAAPSGSQADPDAETNLSSRTRISAMIREDWAQSAKEDGNDNSLWEDVFGFVSSTSSRYTRSDVPVQLLEEDMHDLWYLFFQASMNISGERAEQDRLVMQILYARELGALLRKGENMEIIGEAVTRDGRIYKDLPFLVGDMTDYWIRESGSMSTDQRQNFASFLAKASAAGVADDKLCGCALIILRDTLESTTRLGKGASSPTVVPERQDDCRSNEGLSIAELLPAANAWIFHAGHKIVQLSDNSVNIFPIQVGMLGDLARAEGVIPETGGFSPQRWLFWVKRLGEIEKSETVGEEEAGTATFARGMMNSMLNIVACSDSTMTRELARQGKLPYQWVFEGKQGPLSS